MELDKDDRAVGRDAEHGGAGEDEGLFTSVAGLHQVLGDERAGAGVELGAGAGGENDRGAGGLGCGGTWSGGCGEQQESENREGAVHGRGSMRLIAVGKQRSGPEAELFARYGARLRPGLVVTEVAEGRGAPLEVKRREGEALLAALPTGGLAVALDLGAPCPGSDGLARLLERWLGTGREPCFLVGGAEGLDAAVLTRADHVLSLGPMTWPHMLVRPMLAEQLFRAQAILSGHPYHRAGRP